MEWLLSLRRSLRRRVSLEPRNYAEQPYWASLVWTVASAPVRGILSATMAAQQAGFTRVIVPLRQAGEAKLVQGIDVFGIASVTQLGAFLKAD
jgi:hypothetical protein